MSINGDIFGPGVNLVIKLAEQAPVGGVLIDDAAATQLANNSQYVITPQPELNFKGMGTVRPFRLEAADPAE